MKLSICISILFLLLQKPGFAIPVPVKQELKSEHDGPGLGHIPPFPAAGGSVKGDPEVKKGDPGVKHEDFNHIPPFRQPEVHGIGQIPAAPRQGHIGNVLGPQNPGRIQRPHSSVTMYKHDKQISSNGGFPAHLHGAFTCAICNMHFRKSKDLGDHLKTTHAKPHGEGTFFHVPRLMMTYYAL